MLPHVHDTFDSPPAYRILLNMEISFEIEEKEITQREVTVTGKRSSDM